MHSFFLLLLLIIIIFVLFFFYCFNFSVHRKEEEFIGFTDDSALAGPWPKVFLGQRKRPSNIVN